MERSAALAVLARLHAAQGAFYAGAPEAEAQLRALLDPAGGREQRWSTVGLYRLAGERGAACRLLPLDPAAFDRIWA